MSITGMRSRIIERRIGALEDELRPEAEVADHLADGGQLLDHQRLDLDQ